jgi:hypothetical protein
LLKRERIKKKIYGTWEEARSDIFDWPVTDIWKHIRLKGSHHLFTIGDRPTIIAIVDTTPE